MLTVAVGEVVISVCPSPSFLTHKLWTRDKLTKLSVPLSLLFCKMRITLYEIISSIAHRRDL